MYRLKLAKSRRRDKKKKAECIQPAVWIAPFGQAESTPLLLVARAWCTVSPANLQLGNILLGSRFFVKCDDSLGVRPRDK